MLNRVRRERQKPWNRLLNMPDGLRAARAAADDIGIAGLAASDTLALIANSGDVSKATALAAA